jgi:pentatricopeptide repeat protein
MKRKEYAKALPYFERGVIAQPDNPNLLESLANGYFRNGRVAEAKTTLQKMHERFPDVYFLDFLRYIHALEEDYGETLKILDSVLEVCTPEIKITTYIEKGFYRGWIGDLSGSRSELQRAEEAAKTAANKGSQARAIWFRSWVYLDQRELDLSRKCLEEFYTLVTQPGPINRAVYDANYKLALGFIECAEGKADSAERRWQEMETLLPAVVPEVRNQELIYAAGLLRAEVRLAQGRVDEVIDFFEKTPPRPRRFVTDWNFYPSYNVPYPKDVLARAYVKKGHIDKAITEYERLTTFDPTTDAQFLIHPKYHYRLGLLYEQKGQKAKAAARYRKFLDLWKAADPKLPEVADAKRRLAALSR